MMLSDHFSLAEMTKSQVAARKHIGNQPDDEAINRLQLLACNILEPVRDFFGAAFSPSSGYRSAGLNIAVGGAPRSQHVNGGAADFEVPGVSNTDLANWIARNLEFDQLILEYFDAQDAYSDWVHCSWSEFNNRSEVLVIDQNGARKLCTAEGF